MGCCESNTERGELNFTSNLTITTQAEFQRLKSEDGFNDISLSSPVEFHEYNSWASEKTNFSRKDGDSSPSTSRSTCFSFHRTENELAFLITSNLTKKPMFQRYELTKFNSYE
ncbi:unnamed protein product [Blepharisma stoltei]|uniref:Uncharacterized protein n=1 Tax=Blepharisma stoltei TaxID=1481888 RepID=A0AAU9J6K1_9CILI|nr:unnamed protein product [Blepharisma stoltei]